MPANRYDILIVGAGVAGSTLAHALSTITSKLRRSPIRVALLERSLSEPDRIVGELLLPTGIAILRKLGMEGALEEIGAVPDHGYYVTLPDRLIRIPFANGQQGLRFRNGRFIMRLREYAKRAPGVDVIEATVNDLIECERTKRVLGVRATRSSLDGDGSKQEKESFLADLVIITDGCFSNFRDKVLGKSSRDSSAGYRSVCTVLRDARLPMPQHANAVLLKAPKTPHVGFYQISEHDIRMMMAVKYPPPSDLKEYILGNVVPQLPVTLHTAIYEALDKRRLRSMPETFLPSVRQGGKQGVFLLGDSWNTRPSIIGGGMTVALNDVMLLAEMLGEVGNYSHWDQISGVLARWYQARKPLALTINLLSIAMHIVFSAQDESLVALRQGCFDYFDSGGDRARVLSCLFSGMALSPMFLLYHSCRVVCYVIWNLFSRPSDSDAKPTRAVPAGVTMWEYPVLFAKSVKLVWTVCIIFFPLIWAEMW